MKPNIHAHQWLSILLLLFGTCGEAGAREALWLATEAGMSVDEVRAAVPGSIGVVEDQSVLATGARELLRLQNYELVGHQFAVKFYFIDSQLKQVTLSLTGGGSFAVARQAFNEVSELLSIKYGAPTSRNSSGWKLPLLQAQWVNGRTNIGLIAMDMGDTDPVFNINYQVRLALEADKL